MEEIHVVKDAALEVPRELAIRAIDKLHAVLLQDVAKLEIVPIGRKVSLVSRRWRGTR